MTRRIETIRVEGKRASGVAWALEGGPYRGRVEAIFDANPGLAGAGVEIPVGTTLVIPEAEASPAQAPERIDLWT